MIFDTHAHYDDHAFDKDREAVIASLKPAGIGHVVDVGASKESLPRVKALADVCIIVPEKETFKIQERHLPIYHALCAMVEATLFEPRSC